MLKWLTISLAAYPITALLVPEPWGEIFRATFIPHIEFSPAFFYVITFIGMAGAVVAMAISDLHG